jgi:hypothetical protein
MPQPTTRRTISLDQVAIASPCSADWNAMPGDDVRRYCDQCDLHVTNLSAMPRDEARSLVQHSVDAGQRLCVQFRRDRRGRMVTRPPRWPRQRWARTALAIATLGLTVPLQAQATSGDGGWFGDVFTMARQAMRFATQWMMPGVRVQQPPGAVGPAAPGQMMIMGDIAVPDKLDERVHSVPPPDAALLGQVTVEPAAIRGRVVVQPEPPTPQPAPAE